MQSVSNETFGPLIAYLVPGATTLAGLSPFIPAVQDWFAVARSDAPTISGFLYLTVAALAAGMTVSAVRWAAVDRLHAKTGLPPPDLDFARLPGKVEELRLLIEIHYSGRRGVLPRPSPLRTGHATFTASGSSKSLTTRIQT